MIPDGPFGDRVRKRLREEQVIWLVTTGQDSTPQPNPVWFVWDGADEILVYNRADAARLTHVAARPEVALHFDAAESGNDVVVLIATAARADDAPAADTHEQYAVKYAEGMVRVSGDAARFAEQYPVPVRFTIGRVRGF